MISCTAHFKNAFSHPGTNRLSDVDAGEEPTAGCRSGRPRETETHRNVAEREEIARTGQGPDAAGREAPGAGQFLETLGRRVGHGAETRGKIT